MALRETTPAFEGMDDTATDIVEATTAPRQAPKTEAPQTTAVAAARTTAVSAGLTNNTILKQLQNAIPTEELETIGYNTFPRITIGTDGYTVNKTRRLGEEITIEVLSWSYVTSITAGENNNPEADKLFRSSYDGINLTDGSGTVEDYIKYLKAEGYDKASAKKYAEVYCNVLSNGKNEQIEPEEIFQLSLSPQSVAQFCRFMLESGLRIRKGIPDSGRIKLGTEVRVKGANRWGVAMFAPA